MRTRIMSQIPRITARIAYWRTGNKITLKPKLSHLAQSRFQTLTFPKLSYPADSHPPTLAPLCLTDRLTTRLQLTQSSASHSQNVIKLLQFTVPVPTILRKRNISPNSSAHTLSSHELSFRPPTTVRDHLPPRSPPWRHHPPPTIATAPRNTSRQHTIRAATHRRRATKARPRKHLSLRSDRTSRAQAG